MYKPADYRLPLLPEMLQNAGYSTAHVGKFHGETAESPDQCGIDVFIPEEDYNSWRAAQGIPPRPRTNGWFGEWDEFATPEQTRLAWGADRVLELLNQSVETNKPFFIRWDPSEPHLPCVPPASMKGIYPPSDIAPWKSFGDPLEDKPYIQQQQLRTWGVEGWSWEQWAPIVSRYLTDITLLDQQIGRLLHALDKLGLAEQTLVIYTADHGDLCGGHGMMDKHFMMYDDVMRVPLILRLPGVIKPGSENEAFVLHEIDLACTLCEAAGMDIPDHFQGRSLLSTLRGDIPPREDIFATYHGCQLGAYSQRMVRNRNWKYIWNATEKDELYNVGKDPSEFVNLIDDPKHADELKHLRLRLLAWMEETGDPLCNAWIRHQLVDGAKI